MLADAFIAHRLAKQRVQLGWDSRPRAARLLGISGGAIATRTNLFIVFQGWRSRLSARRPHANALLDLLQLSAAGKDFFNPPCDTHLFIFADQCMIFD